MSLIIDASYEELVRKANLPSSTSYTIACWLKPTGIETAGAANTSIWIATRTDGAATDRHAIFQEQTTSSQFLHKIVSSSGTPTSFTNAMDTTAGAWYYLALTCSGTGASACVGYLFNASGTLIESKTQAGHTFTPGAMGVGAQNGTATKGYYAYGRIWDVALSQAELEAELRSLTIVKTANINTAFATLNGTDVSGNSRDWAPDGSSVTWDSSGNHEPPTFTTEYLRLLAHPTAASASSIEGVVLNAARDTVIGEFSGQAFESALDGTTGAAELLIPTSEISPNGTTLTTADAPLAVAYNASFTTGLVTCTVVEE